jgi:hypothetical protein
MKLRPPTPHPTGLRAWTLTETLVSSSLIILLLAGMIVVQIGGMRMQRITEVKLNASDDARRALNSLIEDVRSAKIVRVGSGGLSSFTAAAANGPQQGNAIQLYATTNTNTFTRYFWDSSDQQLKRAANGSNAVVVLAGSITNPVVFASEDAFGQVLTNGQNNRVIRLFLQFSQLVNPDLEFGTGGLFDYYQIQTRITRRTLE